jgi:hypothetical protein
MDRRTRSANLLVRFAKLKGPTAALRSARHNLRELALTPNITPGQQHLNRVLLGHQRADAVNAAYKAQLEAAGIDKLRVDAVRLIEALVSLPVGIHDDECTYFQAALDWMATEFGSANLLSAVVHKDESAQHMHVLIVPLVQGRMQGSDLLGGKAQLRARLARFEQAMQPQAAALGLLDYSDMALTAEQMAGEVIRALQHRKDPMWKSCVAQLLRNCIEEAPQAFYAALAPMLGPADTLSPPRPRCRPKRTKTMAEFFTKPITKLRGAAAERYRQSPEYQRAHITAPARPKPAASTACARTILDAPRSSSPPVHVVIGLKLPALQKRTLCSVGFVGAGPTWPIHMSIGILTPPRSTLQASIARVRAMPFTSRPTTKFPQPAPQRTSWLVATVPLNCVLLQWWLLKARVP